MSNLALSNSNFYNAVSVVNSKETNRVKSDKAKLYELANKFADLAKEPVGDGDVDKFNFDTLLSFGDDGNKPNFLRKYNDNRLNFLKACSELVEGNVQFLKKNNSLVNLSKKMESIKSLISLLHDFIVKHETFRELLRGKITKENDYWKKYYDSKHGNTKNVATILSDICGKAINSNNFKEKLNACFTLIISLSLAYEFELFNHKK